MKLLKQIVLYSLILFFLSQTYALEKRNQPQDFTIAIIIPCHIKHINNLYPLLKRYAEEQTVIPNEIVISLSDVSNYSSNLKKLKEIREKIIHLRESKWPFHLKLQCLDKHANASQNRNIACHLASADIVIGQDADDVPHYQRTEIIKWFFDHYYVDHLLHRFVFHKENYRFFPLQDFSSISIDHSPTYNSHARLSNPGVAVFREIANKLQWDPSFDWGEDVDFNRRVYERYSNCIVLEYPLYVFYRDVSINELENCPFENYKGY